jgi:hypothetical protein
MRIYFNDGTYVDSVSGMKESDIFESLLESKLGQVMYHNVVNDTLSEYGEQLYKTLDVAASIIQNSKKLLDMFQSAKSVSRKEIVSMLEKINTDADHLYNDIEFNAIELDKGERLV